MTAKLKICSRESTSIFHKVKSIKNLEATREKLLDRDYCCQELKILNDLIDVYYHNKDINEKLSSYYKTYFDKLIEKRYCQYNFPTLYETALEMGIDAREEQLFRYYPQGDITVSNNKGEFLIELCSTYIDIKKKTNLYFSGQSKIRHSQQIAEKNGLKFRFLLIKTDQDKFEESFSKNEAARIKAFLKMLKQDGVPITKLCLPPKEFFTPIDYFLNLSHNEANVKIRLQKIINKCISMT